jgi:hypothetical protein
MTFARPLPAIRSWNLALRYDRSEQTITAPLTLACALICHCDPPAHDRSPTTS